MGASWSPVQKIGGQIPHLVPPLGNGRIGGVIRLR